MQRSVETLPTQFLPLSHFSNLCIILIYSCSLPESTAPLVVKKSHSWISQEHCLRPFQSQRLYCGKCPPPSARDPNEANCLNVSNQPHDAQPAAATRLLTRWIVQESGTWCSTVASTTNIVACTSTWFSLADASRNPAFHCSAHFLPSSALMTLKKTKRLLTS